MRAFLFAVLLGSNAAAAAWHQLPDGFGSPTRVVARGRVLVGDKPIPAHLNDGSLDNLTANLGALETDEVPGALVEVTLGELTARVTANDDGVWQVVLKPVTPLAPGQHTGTVQLLEPKPQPEDRGARATFVLHVVKDGSLAVITDFDDTVAETGVNSLKALLKNALLKNEKQLSPVRGVAKAYQAAHARGATFFFVSGSPLAYHERIGRFLELQGVPRGPLFLKNLGDTSLTEQQGYKAGHIDTIMRALPKVRFVLVGDSGEHDPEIYRAARKRYPEHVLAVLIRKVPGDASPRKRFKDMVVVKDYRKPNTLTRLLYPEPLSLPLRSLKKSGPSSKPR